MLRRIFTPFASHMAFKFNHVKCYAANSKWTILQIIIAIDLYKKQLIHDVCQPGLLLKLSTNSPWTLTAANWPQTSTRCCTSKAYGSPSSNHNKQRWYNSAPGTQQRVHLNNTCAGLELVNDGHRRGPVYTVYLVNVLIVVVCRIRSAYNIVLCGFTRLQHI